MVLSEHKLRSWGERARFLSIFVCPLELSGEHIVAPLSFNNHCELNLKVVFKNMREKDNLAILGKIIGSYFCDVSSVVPLNYRAFLCWFIMLKMLRDSSLWSNDVYMDASGCLWPGDVKSWSEDLLEFKLTIFCRALRVSDRICTNVVNAAGGGSSKKFLWHNACNYKL
ncbi:hypothetical protein FXO38_03946 [Capsicum annuum]|nr:hypothetical protein FXO38_03946 [Capsicum annuum]